MLEAIYSSKMFLASKNKSKIQSALNDPMNGELVQQLRSYLDDDFLKESEELKDQEEFAKSLNELDDVPTENEESFDDFTENAPSYGEPSKPSRSSSPSHSMTEDFDSLSDQGVPDANDPMVETESSSDDTETEPSDDTVEESKKIKSSTITPDLMAILNASDATKGVRRINSSIDSELWIYYDDSVNLNHVMENVISSVNTCCPNVEFSRLARTYNAVVFSV